MCRETTERGKQLHLTEFLVILKLDVTFFLRREA